MYKLNNLEVVKVIADSSREEMLRQLDSFNREQNLNLGIKVYLHWTRGYYDELEPYYHINILGDGDVYLSCDSFSENRALMGNRATGSVSVALCCCRGATIDSLNPYPPTEAQLESLFSVLKFLVQGLNIKISKESILTNGEAGACEDGLSLHEPYALWTGAKNGSWDLEFLGNKESPEYNPFGSSRGGDYIRTRLKNLMEEG